MQNFRTLVFLFTLFLAYHGQAQSLTCCTASAPAEFAALGDEAAFGEAHARPRQSQYEGMGKMILFDTPDGKKANAFLIPARVPTNKYLFIFHEWWGLNDNIKNEAQKYYGALDAVNVLAIDLYDGAVAEDRDKARELMQAASDERVRNIIKGAIRYAGDLADVATVGWCYGGSWSLQAAIMLGDQADACVMYYGMPEKEVEQLKKLQCPVLGHFAINDPWISTDVVQQFKENMRQADRTLEVMTFDANHAFANPSNENYNGVAAGKAYSITIDFIKGLLTER